MKSTTEISVLVYQTPETWVAQALEFDIAAFAATMAELPAALMRAVAANACANAALGRNGLEGIPPAPARFHEMYQQATMIMEPKEPLAQSMPPALGNVHLKMAA